MLAAPKLGAPIKWIEDRRENLMTAGQARHEHGAARLAFDDDGVLLAAALDAVQDVGAYPTPWPVGVAAAVGMLFPGPYRVPRATFTAKAVYSNTVGRTAYRGPWQFESVAREVLLDIAARRIGLDPVELRRRNLLGPDDLPYIERDRVHLRPRHAAGDLRAGDRQARLRGLPPRAGRSACGGSLPRRRHVLVHRADDAGLRRLRHGGCDDPDRAVGHRQRVRRRRFERQQPRDHGGAARRRRARRRRRRRRDDPGRHRAHAVRRRSVREPERVDDRRRGCRDRVRAAGARARHRCTPPRGGGRGPRAGRGSRERARDAVDRGHLRRARADRVPRATGAASGRACRTRGERAVHLRDIPGLDERDPRVHVRGRRRDRASAIVAAHRRGGLRSDDQPVGRRGSDRRRDGAGDRRRAVRAPRVRRGREPGDDDVPRLPAADRVRGPGHRTRSRRDPRAPGPAGTRVWGRAARSVRRRR